MVKRIIIWVLVIAFAYFFFSTIAKTCDNKVGDAAGTAASTIGDATQSGANRVKEIASFEDDTSGEAYDIDDENDRSSRNKLDEEDLKYDDDAEEDKGSSATARKTTDEDEELDVDAINAKLRSVSSGKITKATKSYLEEEKADDAREASVEAEEKSRSTSGSSDFSSSQRYLVVAGSYKEKQNAEVMVEKLKGMGYDDAELFTFDFAEYYSVTAGRFATRDAANTVASKLKSKGIDCYSHKMRSKYLD